MSRSRSAPTRTPIAPRPKKKSRQRSLLWQIAAWLLLIGSLVAGVWAWHLDTQMRDKFSGKRWSIPAKVYARPLELFAGAPISREDFLLELGALGYRNVSQISGPGDMQPGKQQVELHGRGFQFYDGEEPARRLRVRFNGNQIAAIEQPGKGELPVARLEPLLIGGLYPADNEDRILVRLDRVPELLPKALIAVEDRDFYSHHGISPKSIARALYANVTAGALVQGGSTLTQQLVKNFFLTSERSLTRKANEALMSLLLEMRYDKQQILEAYLNEVFLGQDGPRAIHGFGLASQHYFAQPLNELRPHQIALLVGLVKGASYYNPRRSPDRAMERRNLVLDLMQEQGLLSREQADTARKQPLGITAPGSLASSRNPAFLDMVKRQLRRDYREEDLTGEGLQIFTSLDPILQFKAEAALESTFQRLGKRKGLEEVETAMVVANPQTGEVQALIGSRQADFAGFNRALDASRPIGSLVKPAVYLTALERPSEYTLTTLLLDEPFSIKGADGKPWEPQNYDHQPHGTLPLYQALAHSYNLSTARLGLNLGVPEVLRTVTRLGVEQDWAPYPAMLLGAGALSPLQVAGMYQTIANGGFHTPLRGIRNVLDGTGTPLKGYPYEVQQRFDPGAVRLLQEALVKVMTDGTGRAAAGRLPGNLVLAGKTGTSNDSRDSWFAGFGQNLLAVVWMGRDDNGKTPLTGATGALQAWADFMTRAQPQSLDRSLPGNVSSVWVDPQTNQASAAGCPGAIQMPYIRGSEPPAGSCGAAQDNAPEWLRDLMR